MNRNILGEKVYYYTDSIENFDLFIKTLQDLDSMESLGGGDVNLWKSWTSSNDVNFIYGQTKTFYLEAIQNLKNEIGEKSEYIYNSIMKTFYDVCKDYASSLGDGDEPKIFPTFNIKKYNAGMAMGSHFDQLDGDKTLRYSMVMYLNDDYDGGEISFQLRNYSGGWTSTEGWLIGAPSVDLDYETAIKNKSIDFGIKPKANSVVIFPAEAPYFHTAHTVKSGFKYMVPGHWIHNNMDFHRQNK
jgi:hypothetical protein